MFLRVEERSHIGRGTRLYVKKWCVLQCDMCSIVFERPWDRKSPQKSFHVCIKCFPAARKKGGLIDLERQKRSIEKFGTKYPAQSDLGKQRMKITCLELYGVEYSRQDPTVKQHQKETLLRRYGVSTVFQIEHVKQSIDRSEATKKAHLTMKIRGSYGKTAPEELCYQLLCERFSVDDVERQAQVNGRWIDFHVKSVDTYVQEDGVYWHGLDRPIEEIAKFKNKRDVTILKTYYRDREQDEWFLTRGMNLKRVTDIQLKTKRKEAIDELFS